MNAASFRSRVLAQLDPWKLDGAIWRRLACAGAARLPEWFRERAPTRVGAALFLASAKARNAVVRNQALLLGLSPHSVAAHRAGLHVFQEFAHCLADALEMSARPDRHFEREYVNVKYLFDAVARNRGVILATAHTGSWEVGGRLFKVHRDSRMTMVMSEEANKSAQTYVDALRKHSGLDVIYATGSNPATALTLLSRLRKNEVVAIQIDRPSPGGRVLEVRLAEARWDVPEGPFRLAQASGAPILPVFLRRSGYRRYAFTLGEPFEIPRRATRDELQSSAQRAILGLEAFVRRYPNQWFHFAPIPHTDAT